MQRYFIEKEKLEKDQLVALSPEDNHHALRVMRGQIEDRAIIVDQTGQAFEAVIQSIDEDVIHWLIGEKLEQGSHELPVQVTIATGLSKNDKLDWIVQKSTEVGMACFQPLQLQRDVVKWPESKKDKRIQRLQKISKEAAEQSHRIKVPSVEPLLSLKEMLANTSHYDYKLIAYEETAKASQHGTLRHILEEIQPNQSLIVVFGSEGGLTKEEVDLLEQEGFRRCSLGPRILRAETAPVYFLSAVSYALEIK